MKSLLILLLILISALPVYIINKWLQHIISPRKSPARFLAYMVTALALVFVYTFLLVVSIKKLFPQLNL
ncbi:MAG: hypothetical protein SFU87_01350 [Chitinophagaceae bacterium]|jgi:hypothetical protein|nr:hypothetical protein [Chitinophagaceae bacterium]